MGLEDDDQQSHVSPKELNELEFIMTFFEIHDEKYETDQVEHERGETVMRSKWLQECINQNIFFEMMKHGFSIEIVTTNE